MTDLNQKQHKVFYGWWIVGACLLISMYTAGAIAYGFTAIIEPIAKEFGWSYTEVSFAASIRGLEAGLLAPLVGLLIDRLGPRKLIFSGIAIFGLSLLLFSRINSLVMFYGVFILMAAGMSTCSGVLPMTVTGYWFRRKVSIATGIVVCGVALGGLLVPLVTRLIDIFKWRVAMTILGVGTLVIFLPLSLLVRHKPEQYGYLPDGDVSTKLKDRTPAQDTEIGIGVKQALKSSAFWHIALGLMCAYLVVGAVTTHVMPYLSTIGISRSTSSLVAGAVPLTSILGRLSSGWFGDRFDKRLVTASGFALISIGMLFFSYAATIGTWLLIPFIIFLGIGYGGPIPMQSALLREYFGRARLGTLIGMLFGVMWIGGFLGPPVAGWAFDRFRSYQGVWFALTGVAVGGMVSLATTPSVKKTMQMVNRLKD